MDQNIGNGFPYQGAGPFCQGPLDLTYKLEMTNGRNSWTRKHFSARRRSGGALGLGGMSPAGRWVMSRMWRSTWGGPRVKPGLVGGG